MTEATGYSQLPGKTTGSLVPGGKAEVSRQFTLADVDPVGRTEAMIVGRPGSGKTVVAGGFPGPFRWLAADGETCIKSLRWAFKEGKMSITDMRQLVAYVPAEDYSKEYYLASPQAFNKMTDMIDYWFGEDEPNWRGGSLVLDSASEINNWVMNLALSINASLPRPDKPLSQSHNINLKAKVRILRGQQDYNSAMALFETFLLDLRLQCARHNRNLIVLCHEHHDEERDEDKGIVRLVGIKPALYGQLRINVPKSFDDVWYMQVYNGKDFKVQMQADHLRDAKTRWGGIMKHEEPANYRYLIGKVRDYHDLSKAEFEKKYAVVAK